MSIAIVILVLLSNKGRWFAETKARTTAICQTITHTHINILMHAYIHTHTYILYT